MLSRPKLQPQDVPYRDAFAALSNARPRDMGSPCAIPVSEVLAYLRLLGIASASLRAKYLRLIQKMDGCYLDHHAKQAEVAASQAANRRRTGQ